MPQVEEYAAIGARLRELEQERAKALGVAPASPIVTDPAPLDYSEPYVDPYGFYAG